LRSRVGRGRSGQSRELRLYVAKRLDLLGRVRDGSSLGSNRVRVGHELPLGCCELVLQFTQLRRVKLIEQSTAPRAESLIRDLLDLVAAVCVQRQEGSAVEIDLPHGAALGGGQKRGLAELAPNDVREVVAVWPSLRRDRRLLKVGLNKVESRLRRFLETCD